MARLENDVFDSYMREIMSKYENPTDATEMIDALKADREDIDMSEYVSVTEYNDLQNKFNDIKQKYVDRFFSETDNKEDLKKNIKDSRNETTVRTFSDLFRED